MAFAKPLGMYQFIKIPFRLNWVAASFQRVMDKALRVMQDCAVAYIDDIFNSSWEAHMTHLRQALKVLWRRGLTANLKNSQLGQEAVQYLGFCIS